MEVIPGGFHPAVCSPRVVDGGVQFPEGKFAAGFELQAFHSSVHEVACEGPFGRMTEDAVEMVNELGYPEVVDVHALTAERSMGKFAREETLDSGFGKSSR